MHGRASLSSITVVLAVATLHCSPAAGEEGTPAWSDGLPAAAAFGGPRGLVPRRAIIHVHSIYSHDACDEGAQDEAERTNEACLARFREALCKARVDAAFLTEHDRWLVRADSLAEALLFRDGDTLVTRDGHPVANRVPCGTLLFAGAENVLMPVGFDSLPEGSREARRDFYDAQGPDAADRFRRFGATVLLSHPENLTLERVAGLDPDGLEVYNPHANFAPRHRAPQGLSRLGAFAGLVPFVLRLTSAHPDLALLAIFHANHEAVDRWDALLASRMVFGFGASDAHENALPIDLADGERADSYSRMLPWVTNVLLTSPGAGDSAGPGEASGVAEASAPTDAEAIERALRRGRLYTVIEAWGTPSGFDFHVRGPGGIAEMGTTIEFTPGQRIVIEPPAVYRRPAALPEPEIRLRLYRIDGHGRRIVLDAGDPIDIAVPGPGAYRVEVGIVPRHLAPYLGDAAGRYLREVPWIYSNPIRLVGTGARSEDR
ncbi:MAG: hypothetical protein ACREMK_00510 [Gemmatimonadota bacterium]